MLRPASGIGWVGAAFYRARAGALVFSFPYGEGGVPIWYHGYTRGVDRGASVCFNGCMGIHGTNDNAES